MSELGDRLREAREAKGVTLEEAEQTTHIRRPFLQALEEERFADLPGEVYGRGFVRNYAEYLGLDPKELLEAYQQATGHTPIHVPSVLDEPLTAPGSHSRGRWAVYGVALVALLVGVIYLWLAYGPGTPFWEREGRLADPAITPTAPVAAVVDITDPTPTLPQPTVEPTYTPGPTEEATQAAPVAEVETAVPTESPAPVEPTEATPTESLSPTPASAGINPSEGITPSEGINVEALATAETYVEVTTDGELEWVGIMAANDTAQWTATQSMTLRVGNAGGLNLAVNGVETGPLGEDGEVIDLEYTPDTLPQG